MVSLLYRKGCSCQTSGLERRSLGKLSLTLGLSYCW
jgi:hypothetical protein